MVSKKLSRPRIQLEVSLLTWECIGNPHDELDKWMEGRTDNKEGRVDG